VGWQGYAHESFALAMRGPEFRNYDVGVLFTHSHNSMLEILAEMGVVGAILVFGGWLAVVKGYLKKGLGASSALMLALMTVSLCHSLLEYPLWYVYFLTPFAVMMSLTPAKAPGWYIVQAGKWPQRFGMAFAALAARPPPLPAGCLCKRGRRARQNGCLLRADAGRSPHRRAPSPSAPRRWQRRPR